MYMNTEKNAKVDSDIMLAIQSKMFEYDALIAQIDEAIEDTDNYGTYSNALPELIRDREKIEAKYKKCVRVAECFFIDIPKIR